MKIIRDNVCRGDCNCGGLMEIRIRDDTELRKLLKLFKQLED